MHPDETTEETTTIDGTTELTLESGRDVFDWLDLALKGLGVIALFLIANG